MRPIEDDAGLKHALKATKLYQAMRDKKPIKIIVLEDLQPEVCEECGQLQELRPYGVRKPNGVRKWVCMELREEESEGDGSRFRRADGRQEPSMMLISIMFIAILGAATICAILLWMIYEHSKVTAKALEQQMVGLAIHLQGLEVVTMSLERLEKRVKVIEDEVS